MGRLRFALPVRGERPSRRIRGQDSGVIPRVGHVHARPFEHIRERGIHRIERALPAPDVGGPPASVAATEIAFTSRLGGRIVNDLTPNGWEQLLKTCAGRLIESGLP